MAKKTAKAKKPAKVKVDIGKHASTITTHHNEVVAEVEAFENGNNAAGRRIRKALQLIRKEAGEFRKSIQLVINQRRQK